VVVWHDYSRARNTHYGDHDEENCDDATWYQRDAQSRERTLQFLTEPWVGPFGCGRERSFAEYEEYAGISFRQRKVQDYTRRNGEPPNPPAEPDWAERTRTRSVRIVLDPATLPAAALDRPLFWYVGFHDNHGIELHREDADGAELQSLLEGSTGSITLTRTFESTAEPVTWTVIPYAHREGWLPGMTGAVVGDYVGVAG
jgi:hypothetical protein